MVALLTAAIIYLAPACASIADVQERAACVASIDASPQDDPDAMTPGDGLDIIDAAKEDDADAE